MGKRMAPPSERAAAAAAPVVAPVVAPGAPAPSLAGVGAAAPATPAGVALAGEEGVVDGTETPGPAAGGPARAAGTGAVPAGGASGAGGVSTARYPRAAAALARGSSAR